MRLLLDTHTLIWAVDEPSKLGPLASVELGDHVNTLIVSTATVWELSIKYSLGKLSLSMPFRQWMEQAIADLGASLLPLTIDHADVLTSLPFHHRDPFDRMLVAQALYENMPLVSSDASMDSYGVVRHW